MPNLYTPQRLPQETLEAYRQRRQQANDLGRQPPYTLLLTPVNQAIKIAYPRNLTHAHS